MIIQDIQIAAAEFEGQTGIRPGTLYVGANQQNELDKLAGEICIRHVIHTGRRAEVCGLDLFLVNAFDYLAVGI